MKRAYRTPVQEFGGYQTFVSPQSKLNLPLDEGGGPSDEEASRWPVTPEKNREKQRVLPTTEDHRKVKDRKVGPTYYNTPKRKPHHNLPNWRTPSESGDEYGHPTKYDYHYPRRRDLTAVLLRTPADRQKNLRGIEKRVKDQYYRRNKNKIKLKRKKDYRTKIKVDPDRKRYKKLYESYPNRYKRRGLSPYYTPAERTKDWRKDQRDEARRKDVSQSELRSKKAEDWNIWPKKTMSPESGWGQTRSLRAPDLTNHPQRGLGGTPPHKPHPNSGVVVKERPNPTDGSGKVLPLWSEALNHHQEVPKDVPDRPLLNVDGVKMARRVALAWSLHHHAHV